MNSEIPETMTDEDAIIEQNRDLERQVLDVIAAQYFPELLQHTRTGIQQIITHQGETYSKPIDVGADEKSETLKISLAGAGGSELDKIQKVANSPNRLHIANEDDVATELVYKNIVVEGTVVMQLTDLGHDPNPRAISAIIRSIAALVPDTDTDPQRQVSVRYAFIVGTPRGSFMQNIELRLTGPRKEAEYALAKIFARTIIVAHEKASRLNHAEEWSTELIGTVISRLKDLTKERDEKLAASTAAKEVVVPVFHILSDANSAMVAVEKELKQAIVGTYHQPKFVYNAGEIQVISDKND